MTDWSSAKFEECADDSDKEERTLEGIFKLNTGLSTMAPKALSYEIKAKRIPGIAQRFTGIVTVPSNMESGTVHANLVSYFNGDSSGITGKRTCEQEVSSFNDLKTAVDDGTVKKDIMPPECFTRLEQRKTFLPEEVRDLLKQIKEKQWPSQVKHEQTAAQGNLKVKVPTAAMGTQRNGKEKNPELVVNVESGLTGEVVVWQFREVDGSLGRQYALDQETQLEIKDLLLKKPTMTTAEFYTECLPLVHKENALMHDKIETLENKLEMSQKKLAEMTEDRNERARDAMDRNTMELKELSVAKMEKEAAEATAEGLRQHNESLKEELRQMKEIAKFGELNSILKSIQEITKKTEEEVGKNTASINRFVNFVGQKNEGKKKMKMFTPALEKLQEMEGDWLIITQGHFFRTATQYRSFGNDLEKLARNDKVERMILAGEGSSMASDLHKKVAVHGGWDDKVVVLIVDGAEQVKDKDIPPVFKANLASSGKILGMAFEDTKPKEVIFVAGPSTTTEIEEARMVIREKFLECVPTADTINMSDMARKMGEGLLEKFCEDGEMTPLATATLFSRLVWRAGNIKERSGDVEVPADLCHLCGFFHDGKACFKAELEEIQERKEEEKEDKNRNKEEDRHSRRDDDRNRYRDGDRNRNGKPPRCQNCNNHHFNECRLLGKKSYREDVSSSYSKGGPSSAKSSKREAN